MEESTLILCLMSFMIGGTLGVFLMALIIGGNRKDDTHGQK